MTATRRRGGFRDLYRFGLIVRDLPAYLRRPITLEQAAATVRERLRTREASFLRLLERGVFGFQGSPYLPLLKHAGCGLEDVRRLVGSAGLDSALRTLRDAGVYVTYEEFKGREPMVRDGRTFQTRPADFDNPFLTAHYEAESGGTTGVATRAPVDLAQLLAQATYSMLAAHAYGVADAPIGVWRGILPDPSGPNVVLREALCGRPPARWFSQIDARDLRLSRLETDVATRVIVAVGRLAGVALPWPEVVPLESAGTVARWAAEAVAARGRAVVLTQVSRALRVCLAAEEAGTRLDGVTFEVGGEPPTPAKVRQIEASGARCFPGYAFFEAGGHVAMGCARPDGPNDLHLNVDSYGIFSAPRRIPLLDAVVPALYFTTLLPTAPKILLNVENDDYGVIEPRACGCPFEELGLITHLRDVRSFSKLTGEGVTLIGSEMVHVLEHVLPARFGGSALDYQLVEEEDEQGFTRLSLFVSPHLDIGDGHDVLGAVWTALGEAGTAADQARSVWRQAGSLRVRRAAPIWTARGKLMPLHLLKRSGGDA